MKYRHCHALLLLLPLLFASCGTLHTAITESRFPPQGRFLPTAEGSAHFIRAGSGPPVVYIHGSLGSTRDLTESPAFPLLTAHYDVIAFDRPGFGYTRRPHNASLSLQDHARALHADLAALHLSQKPILVGHSMGGAVALAYAELYPDETAGLVLLGALAYPPGPPSALSKLAATPILGDLFLETLAQPLAAILGPAHLHSLFGDTPIPPHYQHAALALALRPAEYHADARDDLVLDASLRAMTPAYPALRIPVQILQGQRDHAVSPQANAVALHAALPASTLILLPSAAHMLQFTAPDEVLAAVNRIAHP